MALSAFRPLNPLEQALADAQEVVERSGIDRTLADLMAKSTGRPRELTYTVRAVLTGMFLAVAAGTPTVKAMTESLWHLAGNARWLRWSGMEDRITVDGAADLIGKDNHRAFLREVDRFRRAYEAMHDAIDASPFPRGVRMLQSERTALLDELANDPDRVLDLEQCDERFFEVTNALVAASAPAALWRPSNHNGSIAVDETRARSHCSNRHGDGTADDKYQAIDPDTAFRNDKKHPKKFCWYHLVQIAVPAGNPYGRRPPPIVVGVYFLHNRGEDDGHGAIGAIRAAINNDWGPKSAKSRALCIADRGISQKHYFARHIIQHGYRPCVDQEEPEPTRAIVAIDNDDRKKWAKSTRNRVVPGEGPELIRGVWLSPAAKHLGFFKNAMAPEEVLLSKDVTDEYIDELVEIDDLTREFRGHMMKENRRPIVDTSDPNPAKWTVSFELSCPVLEFGRCAARPETMKRDPATNFTVRNPPALDHLPKCCVQRTVTIVQPISVVKHIDAFPRFSFEHEDHYNWNRTHNEQRNFDWARSMLGGLDPSDIEVLGRARVGMLITISIARANLIAIRRLERTSGHKDNLPLNIRNSYRVRRTTLIAERRRRRVAPGKATPNRSDKSRNVKRVPRPGTKPRP